jgi:hypothetical protein
VHLKGGGAGETEGDARAYSTREVWRRLHARGLHIMMPANRQV